MGTEFRGPREKIQLHHRDFSRRASPQVRGAEKCLTQNSSLTRRELGSGYKSPAMKIRAAVFFAAHLALSLPRFRVAACAFRTEVN